MAKLITETKATFGTLSALLKQCERLRTDQAGPIEVIRADVEMWAEEFGNLMELPVATDPIDDAA